jgi:hypothetical protein
MAIKSPSTRMNSASSSTMNGLLEDRAAIVFAATSAACAFAAMRASCTFSMPVLTKSRTKVATG